MTYSCITVLTCFSSLEPTSITEAPEDTEVLVGDEVILKCGASFDPMLDIAFIWAIDFRIIDFESEWEHYERVMVGQWFILSLFNTLMCLTWHQKVFCFPSSFMSLSASWSSEWWWQRWPENNERPDLAWRSLHLHGSDSRGQRYSICWSQGCRSVPTCFAWNDHRCRGYLWSYISCCWFSYRQISRASINYVYNSLPFLLDPGVPGPPGIIRVEEIGDTWVKLLWSKGADHNSPILSYTIQTRHFWALNEDDWRDASSCE